MQSIAISDALTGQYADEKAFLGALVGEVNLRFKLAGVPGCSLREVRWRAVDGIRQATIVADAGTEPLTVDRCSAWHREHLAREKARAAQLESEGRLL